MTQAVAEWLALGLLLLASGFFSSAEAALFSLHPIRIHRLRKARPRAADRIEAMLAAPTQLLSTVLIGNTLVNVTVAVVGYSIAERLFPGHGEAISIPVMTVLLLLFGEVTPKRLAIRYPERLAVLYCPFLRGLIWFLTPARIGLEWASGMFREHLRPRSHGFTEAEFRSIVEMAEEQRVLHREDRTMVDGILDLKNTQASDVMIPRVDLIGVDRESSPEECERIARDSRFRFLPVYRRNLDRVEGFLDVPKYLLSEPHNLQAAMIPPLFVPETSPLDTVLETFLRENRRLAFVTDEFGGTAGLLARGHVLAEIVPDVESEYGDAKPGLLRMGQNAWLVHGRTSLDDINYELSLELEAEGADRIAGWVIATAQRIPRAGDVIEAQGCRVAVQRVKNNRVTHVLLEKTEPPGEPEKETIE